jgi:hypothetical protein
LDILALILADHDEAALALDQLLALVERPDPGADVTARTTAIIDLLRLHMAAEQRVLYQTALSLEGPLHEAAIAGAIEHDLIERVLARLEVALAAGNGELRAVVRVLVDLVRQNGRRREEETMFPRLREDLTIDERAALGLALLAEKERLRRSDGYARRRRS